jgi:iron complex outermembrane receptor protein
MCKRIISFFHIGYTNSIVNYNGQKSITVSLEKMQTLNEVVIQVVMVTVKKKILTGAVTVLTSEDLKRTSNSADQMITGKVGKRQVSKWWCFGSKGGSLCGA